MREYVDLNINDGRGITKFCRIVCEQVRLRNVERILIVSPWITPRTQSEYNLERMMEVMGRSRSLRDSVLLTVITRPPILGDFMGAGERHAEAILQLLKHPICDVNLVSKLHTKLYFVEFRDGFMGGRFTVFGSANWTWQAESNTNHETLLEIHGQNERLTDMFIHTLKELKPLVSNSITSRIIEQWGIKNIEDLCEYIGSD